MMGCGRIIALVTVDKNTEAAEDNVYNLGQFAGWL